MTATLPLSLRHAFRLIARSPVFSATVVLTLAVGIGATAAVFAVVYGVLLRPLPYRDAERLVTVWSYNPNNAFSGSRGLAGTRVDPLTAVAPPFLHELRPRLRAIGRLGGLSSSWPVTIGGGGAPEVVDAVYVTDDLIDMLGITPRRGRDFTAAEHAPGGPRVAIVSEAVWRARCSAREDLAEAAIYVNGERHAVVGVMPTGVSLPGTSSEIWLPFALNPFVTHATIPVLHLVGALAPAAGIADARAELDRASASLQPLLKEIRGEKLVLVPLQERLAADSRRISLVLFAAVSLLTLIGCANVSNLLLSRHAARAREIALRTAIGARRSQVVGQLLLESVLLALAGGVAGVALSWLLVRYLQVWLAASLPEGIQIGIDPWVVAFALLSSLLCMIVFGLAPAWQASRGSAADALRPGTRVTSSGDARLQGVLVAIEVALALVLVTGAALLTRSLAALTSVNPGFSTENIITGGLAFPPSRYPQPGQRRAFVLGLEERLASLPGVSAGLVNRLPLGSASNNIVAVEAEGTAVSFEHRGMIDRRVGSVGYFDALRIPILRGRGFRHTDTAGAPLVAVVNAAMARGVWGGADPIGRRVRIGLLSGPGPWLTVVGVLGNVRHVGLDSAERPEIWVPYAQAPVESMVLTVRASAAGTALVHTIRKVVLDADPELPLANPRTMEAVVAASVAQPRSRTQLLSSIAIVALLLSAVGITGVVSYAAARMKRDIGVRMALGATAGDVRSLVTRRILPPVASGAAAGIALSTAASRALQSFLFEVSPTDPLALAGAAVTVLALAWTAARIPAWRASRADPSAILREP